MAATAVHVVPRPTGGWAVQREGGKRATSTHSTQAEAAKAGRTIAKRDKVEFFVHGKDGQIRTRDSYGHDPYPPKG
jgi:hypothetical protein